MNPYSTSGHRRYCRLFPPGTRPARDSAAWKDYVQATKDLSDCMVDDFQPICDCKPDVRIPGGFTYFGQLVDHDTTKDQSKFEELWETPAQQLLNAHSSFLDLDVLYGRGPKSRTDCCLYEDGRFKVGDKVEPIGGGADAISFDIAVGEDGQPLAADDRTAENIIQRQLVAAFARLHNAAVDQFEEEGCRPEELFRKARLQVTWQYQWLVRGDYLGRVLDPQVYDEVFLHGRTQFVWPAFSIPIEFAAAAFRFGHSMVREQYLLSSDTEATLKEIMLRSCKPGALEAEWRIDWGRFFSGAGQHAAITAMPIDTKIADTLHHIPRAVADRFDIGFFARGSEPVNLPHTSLQRGCLLELPSGQAAARALGHPALTQSELTCDCSEQITDQGRILRKGALTDATPLWYYLLKESEVRCNGNRLGPTGSRIVAETLYSALLADPNSILNHCGAGSRPPTWTFLGHQEQFTSVAALFAAIGGCLGRD